MREIRYTLPASSKKKSSHAGWWILVFALALFLGWLWMHSAKPNRRTAKNPPVVVVVQSPQKKPAHPIFVEKPLSHSNPTATSDSSNAIILPIAPTVAETNVPPSPAGYPRQVKNIFEAQIALLQDGISSGSLDGALGSQTHSALSAYQRQNDLPITGELDDSTKNNLLLNHPPLTTYTVTSNDLARLQPVSSTWLGKSQQTVLDFETILELVSEKSFSHPNLIRKLNPAIDWNRVTAGTILQLPDAAYPDDTPKAAWVTIHLSGKILEAFDSETNLIVHFPCSIAHRFEKRPLGLLHVVVVAPDPNYTFDPQLFPDAPESKTLDHKLIIPPGPNNPVGIAWMGLDRPGYGMHGTPRPEEVGRTESHGCFRLANWNARYLMQLITIGTPVYVVN